MTPLLTPGVYVKEVPAQSKPIEGVGTSVAAFIGLAPWGPVNVPVQIPNWAAFVKTFSDPGKAGALPFMKGAFLAHAVYGFFQNGGSLCWVVRVSNGDGKQTRQATLPAATDENVELFRAVERDDVSGEITIDLVEEAPSPTPEPPRDGDDKGDGKTAPDPTPTYGLVVTSGEEREEYAGLTLKRGRSNLASKVNAASKLIRIEEQQAGSPEVHGAPAPGTYRLSAPPVPAEEVTTADFEGDVTRREGMGSLAAIDEVSMICVPDAMALLKDGDDFALRDLQGKVIAHCEGGGEEQSGGGRMAILDPPPGLRPPEVLDWVKRGNLDSKFATLYYPWLRVKDPLTDRPLEVPPCGHVAGIWARTDSTRGVHKAPANETVLGVNELGFQVTHGEQGALNFAGINCIRAFPGRGIRVWGARTLSGDPEWKYLNVRRLFNYISGSIMEGTQWSVFEPNDPRLWMQLNIAATNFLTRTWREGALFGATPDEAFFVKCDAETNPPELIEAGQVVVEIGIAPVKPAEFIVFQISQFAAGAAEVSA